MTSWKYLEPGEAQDAIEIEVTEEEILATYYPYWCGQMCRVGKEHLISAAACIEDFAVVHWAWPVI